MRVRMAPTAVVRTTHQAVEPSSTPSTTSAASPVAPVVTPSPAKSAPKERIVIGFAIVRPRIERYAPAYPRRQVVTTAASVGVERIVSQASHSRNDPPDETEDLPRVHQRVRDRRQPERGDRSIRGVGRRDAEPRDQPVEPSLGEGAADDEQADRADRGGDREAEDKSAERERGIHWVSFRRPRLARPSPATLPT